MPKKSQQQQHKRMKWKRQATHGLIVHIIDFFCFFTLILGNQPQQLSNNKNNNNGRTKPTHDEDTKEQGNVIL